MPLSAQNVQFFSESLAEIRRNDLLGRGRRFTAEERAGGWGLIGTVIECVVSVDGTYARLRRDRVLAVSRLGLTSASAKEFVDNTQVW